MLESYIQSDTVGKLVFIGLGLLSSISWTLMIYKMLYIRSISKSANKLQKEFEGLQEHPLNLEVSETLEKDKEYNPFKYLYMIFKEQSLKRLKKNHHFLQIETGLQESSQHVYLSPTDIDYIEACLATEIGNQTHDLEKDLIALSITITLAPFLGLLGTVWGILMTFSELQTKSGGGNEAVLAGISMALGTTVVGLVVAIPALIGYSYFRGAIQSLEVKMDNFVTQMISAIEMQYRKVDSIK
ncbi:MAG: TolQ protein [Chlamydiales bacterium]|nr:TolQ protein [Chlamydiales bacterium]